MSWGSKRWRLSSERSDAKILVSHRLKGGAKAPAFMRGMAYVQQWEPAQIVVSNGAG
jgi:hypothetical protein